MNQNQKQKSKRITQKSLAEDLMRLPELEVPETLQAKLLAAIPVRHANLTQTHQLRWYRAWDFGVTAAAAVLIFALMFLVNYGLSTTSQTSIIEFDTSLCHTRWDQSKFLYDQNNTYLEKSLQYKLK